MEISKTLEYLRKRQKEIHRKMFSTGYIICSKPDHIAFECPYCLEDKEIKVADLEEDVFEITEVICPNCGRIVKMGEWTYD